MDALNSTVPNSYSVTAKVLHKESGKPLPDLLVVLFDMDNFNDPENKGSVRIASASGDGAASSFDLAALYRSGNRLFSAITDGDGKVSAYITARDFNTGPEDEQKPDLLLLVFSPEEPGVDVQHRLLYLSNEVRFNAGSSEAYIIKLGSDLLKARGIDPTQTDGGAPVEDKISAYRARSADDQRYNDAIFNVEKEKIAAKQVDLKTYKAEFMSLLAPLPPIDPRFSTYVAEDEKVADKADAHYTKEVEGGQTAIARHVEEEGGIKVTFVLNEEERNALGLDVTSQQNKHFTDIETTEPLRSVLGEMNAAGGDNLVLTSNNPILKKCLKKSDDTVCATEQLGIASGGGTQEGSRTSIAFDELPEAARAYLNGNYPNPSVVSVLRVTAPGGESSYEVSLAGNIVLHFDSLGINKDDATPLTAQEVAVFVKKALTDIRSLRRSTQNGASRPDQEAVNSNVDNFSLRKGPAELPSFYDFQVLNIAFHHIWQQLVDEEPAQLAAQIKLVAQSRGYVLSNLHTSIGGLLGELTQISTMLSSPPELVVSNFDVTYEEWNALELLAQTKLVEICTAIDKANLGLIYRPGGIEVVHTVLADIERPVPAGYERVAPAVAEQYIEKLKAQGELLIDYVRGSGARSFHRILMDLDNALKSNYAFNVFGADETAKAINFGLLNTYRQEWMPVAYQVGNLVKSIPLSPKEERKYSLKTTFTRKRSEKEAKKNNSSLTQEQDTTSRAEEEIVSRAQTKTDFHLATEGNFGKWKVTSSLGLEANKESSQNRRDFRESVLKATQSYLSERSVEISTEETYSTEYNESGTIVNPNDELAVTYLFYELQKRFKVSEQLYRVMPVVLVAQDVPAPSEITEAWVISHDWILNRVILDDSFRPALQYIAQKNVGDDFAIRELRRNLRAQRQLVESLKRELASLNAEADSRYRALENEIKARIQQEQEQESDNFWDDVGETLFGADKPTPESAKAREMAARDAQAYAADKAQKMAVNLQQEVNNLQSLTADYNKAMREHLDKKTMVERLLLHIKNYIIYYMQQIWSMEPSDQRYMRLLNVQVPQLEIDTLSCDIMQAPDDDIFQFFRKPGETLHRAWLQPVIKRGEDKPLVEVADLDTILGYKGNYMVFPMKQHNGLTELMAMPYIDASFGAMDPDQLSNVSLEDYARYVCCLRDELGEEAFNDPRLKSTLKRWLELLLEDPLRNGDEIIVPTNSLYSEMLLSDNSLLEDFKLMHREWDVYKVQEEVEMQALENLRVAKRILLDKLEDPKIDKKVIVEGPVGANIDVNDN